MTPRNDVPPDGDWHYAEDQASAEIGIRALIEQGYALEGGGVVEYVLPGRPPRGLVARLRAAFGGRTEAASAPDRARLVIAWVTPEDAVRWGAHMGRYRAAVEGAMTACHWHFMVPREPTMPGPAFAVLSLDVAPDDDLHFVMTAPPAVGFLEHVAEEGNLAIFEHEPSDDALAGRAPWPRHVRLVWDPQASTGLRSFVTRARAWETARDAGTAHA